VLWLLGRPPSCTYLTAYSAHHITVHPILHGFLFPSFLLIHFVLVVSNSPSLFLARLTVFSRGVRFRCRQSRFLRSATWIRRLFDGLHRYCGQLPPPLARLGSRVRRTGAWSPISRDHIHNDQTNDRRQDRDVDHGSWRRHNIRDTSVPTLL